jgi:hypothetical protein
MFHTLFADGKSVSRSARIHKAPAHSEKRLSLIRKQNGHSDVSDYRSYLRHYPGTRAYGR